MALNIRDTNLSFHLPSWKAIVAELKTPCEIREIVQDDGWDSYMPSTGDEFTISTNRYRLDRPIGKGSFKTVFVAVRIESKEDSSLPNKVAALYWRVKSQECFKKIVEETKNLRELKEFPGIVQMIETPRRMGKFFVMTCTELCENGTINSWAKNQPIDRRLEMTLQAAKILQLLHARGFAHGDVKPENIGIYGSCVKLLDVGSLEIDGHNKSAPFNGTIAYAPPDVENEENSPIERDVFAFGALIFDLLMIEPGNSSLVNCVLQMNGSRTRSSYCMTHAITQEELDPVITTLPEPISSFLLPILRLNPRERTKMDKVVIHLNELLREFPKDFFGIPGFVERTHSDDFFRSRTQSFE